MTDVAQDEPDGPTPLHEGPPSLIDLLPRRGGYVVDEREALDSPCLRRELRRGGDIVFSKGIVGPLDVEQQARYCSAGYETLPLTERQEEQLNRFAEAAHACKGEEGDEPKGQRFPAYLSCMERELRAREAAE